MNHSKSSIPEETTVEVLHTNYIISFLHKKMSNLFSTPPSPFNAVYKQGYKNAWINNIKDYTP